MGTGSTDEYHSFTQIGSDTDWDIVWSNNTRSFAIKNDGTLWATGRQFYGELGLGLGHSMATVLGWTQVGSYSDWLAINGSDRSTTGIRGNGRVYQCGFLDRIGPTPHDVFQIHEALNMASVNGAKQVGFYLDNDGQLWFEGDNLFGVAGAIETGYRIPYRTNMESTSYINGEEFTGNIIESHDTDIAGLLIDRISTVELSNVTYTVPSDQNVLLMWNLTNNDYMKINVFEYSAIARDKSVLHMDSCGLDGVKVDNSYSRIGDFSAAVGWNVYNNSTLIVDTDNVTSIVDVKESMYILEGVEQ